MAYQNTQLKLGICDLDLFLTQVETLHLFFFATSYSRYVGMAHNFNI